MELLERFATVLEDVAGVDPAEVSADKTLIEDLDIDSLAMVEVTLAVQDRFGVAIPDDAVASLRTVGDVVQYLEANHVSA
jgi:acyl carrier protein